MRLSTLLLLILVLGSLAGTGWLLWHVTAERRQWDEMLSWSGTDLKGTGMERIRDLADTLAQVPSGGSSVRWIARLQGPGSRDRMLLAQPLPSDEVRLTLLDDRRQQIFSVVARARLRTESMTGLRGNTRPDLAPWTFAVVKDGSGVDGVGLDHYALIGDRPTLVRLERVSGASVSNEYQNGTPVGLLPPIRSPEEWERSLSSGNLAEILETLHWLGGLHDSTEPPEQYRMFLDTVASSTLSARLRDLCRHPHPWISHAAEKARNHLRK